MRVDGYRAPLIAGLVLVAGLALWTRIEVLEMRARHVDEMRRHADGVFLAMAVSHAGARPRNPWAGKVGHPPHHLVAERLRPVMAGIVHARPNVRFVALFLDGAVEAEAGEAPAALEITTSIGERFEDGLFLTWRPLGLPSFAGTEATNRPRGSRPPPRGEGPPRAGPGGTWRDSPPEPPPGAPVILVGQEAALPAHAVRRHMAQIVQKIGVAALGVIALLAAWVQGIRRRELANRLEAEQGQRAHLEELSLAASGLAHETKNPLGIIRGLAQRMEQDQGLPEPERERASQILDEADRAVARLGDFMSYARIREPELASVDVREILDKAVAVLAADLEAAGVTATVQAPHVMVLADPEMLLQILLNLLLNSLQASQAGDALTLRLAVDRQYTILSVEDQGRGMEPKLLADVFKPYVTGRADGHGLGLAIVRRLAEQHGWTVEIQSEPGRGTRVDIDGIRMADPEKDAP